ncbi:MAG: tyrosine-type recombinase/integrase [Desulfobacterium sp.]|nr:tyrosine-type recombinase/integrase [Desulfobacterium sp.]
MIEFWGEDPLLNELHPKLFISFLDHVFTAKGGHTANRYLREINSLFKWLINQEYTDANPSAKIEEYSAEPFKKYVPPREDIQAVLQIASPSEKDILRTIFFSLARAGEIRRTKWSDCDFEKNMLTLWTRKRKSGALEGDDIEMAKGLREILHRRYVTRPEKEEYVFPGPKGGKLSKNTIDKILPRLFRIVNTDENGNLKPEEDQITRFTMHSIRHHSAALLATRLPLPEVQKILRHKRASTTDNYLRSLVKVSTKGISVLDDLENPETDQEQDDNVVSFEQAANGGTGGTNGGTKKIS